jgi:HSP20 family protein
MGKDMPQIRMDVKESEKAYAVHAEIPGVTKEDIHVTIDGKTVSIRAEVKKNTEQKEGEKVLRSERHFGRVSRSFALEQELDEASASARYQDGVLDWCCRKKRPPQRSGWRCSKAGLRQQKGGCAPPFLLA